MPVAPSSRNPRNVLLAVGGLTFAVALAIGIFVFAVPSLQESGQIESNLGDEVFTLPIDEELADEIAENGPITLSDVAGGDRDIFVQHLGDDPTKGWLVFSTRPPDEGRECTLSWNADDAVFDDPCSDRTFPADGEGLTQYPVEIEDDEALVIDLNFADRPAETTTTVLVTGG